MLRYGSEGPSVTKLQDQLRAAGFDPGASDGVFGSKTLAAVKAFQKAKGLSVDGIVGPKTQGALDGGGSSTSTKTSTSTGTSTGDDEVTKYLRETYGPLAWAVDHPELGPILREAAADGWGSTEIQGAITQTKWWTENSDHIRQFTQRENEDPASLEADIQAESLFFEVAAERLGGSLSGDRLRKLATDSLKFNWSNQQKASALTEAIKAPNKGYAAGDLGATKLDLQALARQYLVTVDDRTLNNFALKVASGAASVSGFEAYVANLAVGKYPTLKKYIEQGITPETFFAPYQQEIASLLEVSPQAVDFAKDARFKPVIDYAGSDGSKRPMTLSETSRYVRGLDEWKRTDNARSEAARLGETLLRTFGVV